jgi:hypothetical protein
MTIPPEGGTTNIDERLMTIPPEGGTTNITTEVRSNEQ